MAAMKIDSFVQRLAAFYGGIFLAVGVLLPFLSVWFAAKGLNAGEIGLVLAAPVVSRVVAVPLVTSLADRLALRPVIIAVATGTACCYGLVGTANGFWLILLAVVLASGAFAPLLPLTDAYALQGLGLRRQSYGPVRLWGSAAFVVGSIGAGLVFDHIAPGDLIWIIVAAFFAAALISFLLLPVESDVPSPPRHRASGLSMLRSAAVLAAIGAASFIQGSHAVYYGFSSLAWSAGGLDGLWIGGLWALGVAAEIVLFALSARLPPAFTPTVLLALGGTGAALRWTVMAFDPPLLLLPLLQGLHAFSFAATHLGAVQFMSHAAAARFAATAQGYLSVAVGVAQSGAIALAGGLYAIWGTQAYAAMAAMAFIGLTFAIIAHRVSDRPSPV
jgi:PPP family 3-phenylpropionic acid transporter